MPWFFSLSVVEAILCEKLAFRSVALVCDVPIDRLGVRAPVRFPYLSMIPSPSMPFFSFFRLLAFISRLVYTSACERLHPFSFFQRQTAGKRRYYTILDVEKHVAARFSLIPENPG